LSDLSTQVLYAEAILGKDAEEFLKTDLGRYLMERVVEEEREAMEALAGTSSWRRRRIVELQNRIWRARSFKSWLSEMIVTGRQALQQLESTEA
jgi:hypothetical protein